MNSLFGNIRFYILTLSVLLSFYLYFSIQDTYFRAQINGILAVIFLYSALLIGPLTRVFPQIPMRGNYIKARRAVGVSAFYFALLHFLSISEVSGGIGVMIGFIFQAPPLLAGAISLIILFLMAITSFDKAVKVMTFPRWKLLHRFVYLVEGLIIFHIVMLGHHFIDRTSLYSILMYVAIVVLVSLQLIAFIKQKSQQVSANT